MTTDMLVTRSCDGAEHFSAFSIKSSEDASRPRTIEKLEIERLYWEQAGVDWSILSEEMLPQVETLNLSWVFGADDTLWNDQADNRSVLSRFANAFAAAPDEQAAAICVLLDKDSKRGAGKHLSVLRAAIKKRLVSIDLRGSLVPQACCNEFAFQLEH